MILDSAKRFSRLRYLVRRLRRCGFRRGCYWGLRSATEKLRLQRWIHLAVVDVFSAAVADLLQLDRVPRAFTVRLAQQDDVTPVQTFFGKPQQVLKRFSEGHCCFLLWSDHAVTAAEWVAIGPNQYEEDSDELRCIFRFAAGTGWLFDGLGSVSGVWGMLMRVLPRELQKRNIQKVYLQTDYANIHSWDSHRSLGFVPVGRVCHVRIAGVGFTAAKSRSDRWWRLLPVKFAGLEITAH